MQIKKNALKVAIAGVVMLASAAAAFAAPATATSNVNVRSGPGGGYSVIDNISRGERVDVQQCRGSWCYVEKRGPDGWVSASYLERGGRGGGYAVNPGVTLEFNFGNASQRPQHSRPPRPDHGGWNGRNNGGWNGGHGGWNSGHGGWNGGHGGWDNDRHRNERPRRPGDWN